MKFAPCKINRFANVACAISFIAIASQVRIGQGQTLPSTRPQSATRPAVPPGVLMLENDLIFPGRNTQGTPQAFWRPIYSEKILNLVAKDGVKIAAVFGDGAPRDIYSLKNRRPILIYFYGNGMCMAASRPIFNEFRHLGYDAIMPDYEGYGMSGGIPSDAGCYATADAVYDYLLTRPDIKQRKIVVIGWSIGAAVAIDLANRRPTAGLITFSAFTNLADEAEHLWPPARALAGSQFDNLSKVRNISCPILMIHGSDDTLVPSEMSDRLAAAAKTKSLRYRIPGAGHNDVFTVGGEPLFEYVQKFVDGL